MPKQKIIMEIYKILDRVRNDKWDNVEAIKTLQPLFEKLNVINNLKQTKIAQNCRRTSKNGI